MKKIFLTSLFLIGVTFYIFSQTTKDIFTLDQLTWYGLDFSKAKMVGSEGFKKPSEIKSKLFNDWNNTIITESIKFDLKRFFRKATVTNELGLVEKRNQTVDVDNLVTNNTYTLELSEVDKIISEYKTDKKEGIGVVFIIESFDKTIAKGTMYVTFFSLATKKVLLTEKMTGKAGGAGLKGYWLGSVFNVLKQIDEGKYKEWKEKN